MDEVRAAFKAASLRPLLRRFFKHFGYHCATHQIRVILISCLVITSLLYPAIAIYAPLRSLSTLSSSLLSILPGDSRSPHLRDLHDAWVGHEALHLRYDATAKARCGLESTVRVERLLLANNRRDENGVLNKDTLRLALDLEKDISARLDSSIGSLSCIRSQTGKCLFTSPLSYWEHDYKTLVDDENVVDTINRLNKTSHAVFPVTLPMVLADRAGLEDEEKVDFATFLVFTYYFRETDCNSQAGHSAWLQLVESAMKGKGQIKTLPGQPTLHAIQFDAESSIISPISILLYLTYLLVFIHFSGSMRRMNTVHSRFGIAFTGIVEIIVSTITSVSVCAIWGFRVTMVPWGILPIVIVFVGAENMFRLVDEVVSTSITLPVKERIGLGLSEAGASNTLKVMTCNTVLGIMAVFAPGAIRQFCVFAVVVLVAHWFLVHTFFVAVLSIDLQRLELHDFLRQDRTVNPEKMDGFKKSAPSSPLESKAPKEPVGLLNQIVQGRAARNGSLIMVLAITAVLYLVTSNAVPGDRNPAYTLDKAVALRKAGVQSPAWKIWQTLNPSDDFLLHMRVETPTLVFLGGQSTSDFRERRIGTRFSHESRKILTIFVLPIATTTALLWALLIYLLKDTEAQTTERVEKEPDDRLEGLSRFSTIPRACKADIDRIDAAQDGSAIIAVSLEDEVVVWQQTSRSFFDLPTFDLDSGNSCPSSVAIASSGSFCAVGTRSGTLALWRLEHGQATNRRILQFPGVNSRIIDMVFEDKPASRETRATMLHRRSLSGDTSATDGYILVTYKDGSVIEWNDLYEPRPRLIVEGSASNARPVILRLNEREPICLALITVDGIVKLWRRDLQGWQEQHHCVVTSPEDPILKVHAQILTIDLTTRIILAVSTRSGVISLWDGCTGECLYQLDETFEDVTRLRLAPVPMKACPNCSELSLDSFTLTLSNGAVAVVHRFTSDNPQRCSCPLLQPAPNNPLRSRQASLTTIGVPPIRPRHNKSNSLSSVPVVADFPVSAHGVHSRRGSEREPPRRQDGGFFLVDGGHSADAADNVLNLRCSKIAEVSFEEGAWDTLGHIIYGLRRAAELETVSESAENVEGIQEHEESEVWTSSFEGLDRPVLERWRFWVFDPTSRDLSVRESTLAALASPATQAKEVTPSAPSGVYNRRTKFPVSLNFVSDELHDTRTYLKPSAFLRLPFTEVSSLLSLGHRSCLAAFGNTVGLITFAIEDSPPSAPKSSYHARSSSAVIPLTSSMFKRRA